jgi:hypothetical protein
MLHEMCHEVLTQADIKAVCRNRGLPLQAAQSRSLFESLFLSDTGVTGALNGLERDELALLHLLKAFGESVDVAFFHRLYRSKERLFFGTYAQRHQDTLAKVKERLVRGGLLIMACAPETDPPTAKMERWRFALPAQVAALLPSLLGSARSLEGPGSWCSHVARDKLKTVVHTAPGREAGNDQLGIVAGELRMGGLPFRAARLHAWQRGQWREEMITTKVPAQPKPQFIERAEDNSCKLAPIEAATRILESLADRMWIDADSLSAPLSVFCGTVVDGQSVCESGWRWGCLAKQEAQGKAWYRLAEEPRAADVSLDRFMEITADGQVKVSLDEVPLESLEDLVATTNQRSAQGSRPSLLLTPNLVKLGPATEDLWTRPLFAWLKDNSTAFRQAAEACEQRRGKTILHENVSVAHVTDLALRVAINKALGDRIVTLGEEFIAFPNEVHAEVRKIVGKSGYVIKEGSLRES